MLDLVLGGLVQLLDGEYSHPKFSVKTDGKLDIHLEKDAESGNPRVSFPSDPTVISKVLISLEINLEYIEIMTAEQKVAVKIKGFFKRINIDLKKFVEDTPKALCMMLDSASDEQEEKEIDDDNSRSNRRKVRKEKRKRHCE